MRWAFRSASRQVVKPMLSFYKLPQTLCVSISMFSAICVIVQAVLFVLRVTRYRTTRAFAMENALEAAVLLQAFLFTLLIAHVINSARDALIVASDYVLFRWTVFLVLTVLSVLTCWFRGKGRGLFLLIPAAMTLPAAETVSGAAYPLLFCGALLFWCARGSYGCMMQYRALKTGISGWSLKEAIDALHTGILFYESDGFVVLVNRRMRELMSVLIGKTARNGLEFSRQLTRGDCLEGCEASELDGCMVYRLPDGSVWMFTEQTIDIGKKHYEQISAADVTQQWNATSRLRRQNHELDRRSGELRETLLNLGAIYRKEETLRTKSRVHDLLGQRIAVLIRILRENEQPDLALLREFAHGLSTGIGKVESQRVTQRELSVMIDMFAGIGVTITFGGSLPTRPGMAELFMDIITESVTNAVRHGFATDINVACIEEASGWTLEITNSGLAPDGPVHEGGGIGSMRRRLVGMGGTLVLQTHPTFILMASVPEGAES